MNYEISHTDLSGLQWISVTLKSKKELDYYKSFMLSRYGQAPYYVTYYNGIDRVKIEERRNFKDNVITY